MARKGKLTQWNQVMSEVRSREGYRVEAKRVTIHPDDIGAGKRYVPHPGYQRTLSKFYVQELVEALEMHGIIPGITLVYDTVQRRYWALDGQHRLEAIRLHGKPVEVTVEVHHGLTREERVTMFTLFNHGRSLKLADKFRAHKDASPAYAAYQKEGKFPLNLSFEGKLSSEECTTVSYINLMTAWLNVHLCRSGLHKSTSELLELWTSDLGKRSMAEMAKLVRELQNCGLVQGKYYGIASLMILLELKTANKPALLRTGFLRLGRNLQPQTEIAQQSGGNLPALRSLFLRRANARAKNRLVFPEYVVVSGGLLG